MSKINSENNIIIQKSIALSQDKSLSNLYKLICENGDSIAAYYTDKDKEQTLTYREYEFMSARFAAYLQNELGKSNIGKYVAFSMDTSPMWFPIFWAVLQSGYNIILLNFGYSGDMTKHLMEESGAIALITENKKDMPDNIKQILVNDIVESNIDTSNLEINFADKIAVCTSGTTGTSKIFVYDGRAISEQVLSSELLHNRCSRIIDVEPKRSLAFLPFHHIFGFITSILWIPFIGYSNVYIPNRSPQTILHACNHYKIQLLITVPLLANNLCVGLEKKLKTQGKLKQSLFKVMKKISLGIQYVSPEAGLWFAKNILFKSILPQLIGPDIDAIILGGSHTPREHLSTLSALGYFTVCGFGMTETAITSVETDMSLRSRLMASVGRPLSNIDYKILPSGNKENIGEMLIKSSAIHIAKLEGGVQVSPERIDGEWFPTGDIVRIEKGKRVFVEGRCKDLIINESGENVYPDEIEDFFSVLNDIEQFSVVGIKKNKNDIYEDISLILNLGSNYNNNDFALKLADEINAINSKLSAIKRIKRVIITPEKLPLVNGIKVKRLELKNNIENNKVAYKDLLLDRKAPVVTKPQPKVVVNKTPSELEIDEIKNKVAVVFAEILEIPKDSIKYDAHFIDDLGGDSLQILSVALKTEELFSVNIAVEEYPQCASINDMSSLLYGKIRGLKTYESEADRSDALEKVVPIKNFTDSPEYIEFHKREQALLKNSDDNPYFVRHESPLLDVSLMDGHEVLNFGSYNYACLSGRKEVNDAAKQAIDKYGTSASGSRLLAGEKQIHRDLEAAIARFKNSEDAIVLVGGHSTNVTFVGNFCGKNDLILYDALAHNSIDQGCRLSAATAKPFPHNNVKALEQMLRMHRDKYEKVLIIIEGAYSMDGDIADVPAFVELKKKYGCFLLVDEAHSTCVIGENGGGVDEYFNLAPDDIDIKMGTLSKGLGTCGGYLAGSKELINYLRYSLPGFVFSVGISPALAGATLEAINLMETDKSIMERMRRNIKCFVDEAEKHNFNICLAGETAIIPILVGSDEDAFILSNAMNKNGVFVPPAVYPAVPKNKARLRFCVVSDHKPEQIKHALDTLATVAKALDIQLPAWDRAK